jgi:hypothetical protein
VSLVTSEREETLMTTETPPNRSVTPRGFDNYDQFTDSYGAEVRVRQSSAASAPHVWLFIAGGRTAGPGAPNDGSAHLDVEQARRVRDALDAFIEERGDE